MELLGEFLKLTVLAGLTIAGILIVLIWKKDLATKVTYLRFVVQLAAAAIVYYLFTFPVWQLVILMVILLMPLLFGRFLCGWLCPFGLYMDVITLVRKALKVRYRNLPEKLNKVLHYLRYFLLLLFSVFLLLILWMIKPPATWDSAIFMALFLAGPFEPLKILLDPITPLIVPWNGPLQINGVELSYPYIQKIIYYSGEVFGPFIALIFVALTVAGAFYLRRAWCRFCPTGSSVAVVNRFKIFRWIPLLHLEKDEEKCAKCGICKRVCPVEVTEVYEEKGGKIRTSMCILCLRCVEMCPYEDCLKLKLGGKTVFKSRNWLKPSEGN
jgi:polyferredoxin